MPVVDTDRGEHAGPGALLHAELAVNMAVLEVDAPAKGPSILQRRHNLSFSQALSITVLLLFALTLFALSTEEIRLSSIYNSEHHVTHAAPGDELRGGGAPPAEPEPYAPEADEPPVSYSQEDILQGKPLTSRNANTTG